MIEPRITPRLIEMAERAVLEMTTQGSLVVVNLPHSAVSLVREFMSRRWLCGSENLLVICHRTDEAHYFGQSDVCLRLRDRFPDAAEMELDHRHTWIRDVVRVNEFAEFAAELASEL